MNALEVLTVYSNRLTDLAFTGITSLCRKSSDGSDISGQKRLATWASVGGLTCLYCSRLNCHPLGELLPRKPPSHHQWHFLTQKEVLLSIPDDLLRWVKAAEGVEGWIELHLCVMILRLHTLHSSCLHS